MSSINAGTINNAANGDKEAMRVLLNAFAAQLNIPGLPGLLEPTSGGKNLSPTSAAPGYATLNVSGANGSYTLSITNPNQTVPATLYHEISYSPNQNFANAVSLPLTSSTSLTLPAPGTKYSWRIRSSYDQAHFNNWKTGALGVSAGLQSSAATENATVLNQTNYANIDSVSAGLSANIRVFGQAGPGFMYPAVKGAAEQILPSATIVNVPPSSNKVIAWDGEGYRVESTLPQVMADGLTPTGSVSVVGGGAVVLPVVAPFEFGGGIIGYNVVSQGNGLTQPVTITLVGTGTGATSGAQTIVAGKLISVAPGNLGTGYGSGTTATVTGGVSGGSVGGGQSLGGQNGRLIYNDVTTGA